MRTEKLLIACLTLCLVVLTVLPVEAANVGAPNPEEKPKDSKDSPWIITPLLSSDPKISTAGGALVGYMHKFDEASPPSIFGVTGTYSTTDSWYLSAFAKAHFGEDKHRLVTGVVTGEVKNDYSDFFRKWIECADNRRLRGVFLSLLLSSLWQLVSWISIHLNQLCYIR